MQSALIRFTDLFRRYRRRLFGLCAVVPLGMMAACSTLDEPEPPSARPCPQARVLGNADQVTYFRDGPGRDVLDIEYEAQIIELAGECVYRRDGTLAATFSPAFRITLGAADNDRRAEFSYFVAIVRRADSAVLNKEVFPVAVEAPPNQSQIRFRDGEVSLSLPLKEGETGAGFQVLLGLQLSEEQLEYNRRQARGRR